MFWTSLNESVCSLGQGNFTLYGKDAKGKVVIKYPFDREFYDAGGAFDMIKVYNDAANLPTGTNGLTAGTSTGTEYDTYCY